jgi:hypothetical protein
MKRSSELPAIGAATVGTGAVLTAAVAGACCVGPALAPIFLTVLGASGLVAISGLRPYTPWLLLGSAAMLTFSFRQLYRTKVCATGTPQRRPSIGMRVARFVVWIAACLWLVSTTYAVYGLLHE